MRIPAVLKIGVVTVALAAAGAWYADNRLAMRVPPPVERERGATVNGRREGLWTIWSNMGHKEGERTYVSGVRQGPSRYFAPDGRQLMEVRFTDGVPDGPSWAIADRGRIEGGYVMGKKQGVWTYSDSLGRKRREVTLVDGVEDGPYKLWDAEGSLAEEGRHKNGKPDGPVVRHYAAGTLEHAPGSTVELVFADGVENGPMVERYPSGQIAARGAYAGGKLNGPMTHWWQNGQKKREGTVKDGAQIGTWMFWDDKGARRVVSFEGGRMIMKDDGTGKAAKAGKKR